LAKGFRVFPFVLSGQRAAFFLFHSRRGIDSL
jgi:hypothetical protein